MKITGNYSMPDANQVFQKMDKDGDGGITAEEFGAKPSLSRFSRNTTNRTSTFNEIDADGDGVIKQNEFARFHNRLTAKMREMMSGASLANYMLDGQSSNSMSSDLTPTTSVEDLLSALEAKSEAEDGDETGESAWSGIPRELKDLVNQLQSILKPGDMLNLDA